MGRIDIILLNLTSYEKPTKDIDTILWEWPIGKHFEWIDKIDSDRDGEQSDGDEWKMVDLIW